MTNSIRLEPLTGHWRPAESSARRVGPGIAKVEMVARKSAETAAAFVPPGATLPQLTEAAQKYKGCDLYRNATQAVLGDGPESVRVVFIGEQPGDQEDLAGRPFVGPAGRLLDEALEDAGLSRSEVYLTNAVKHFNLRSAASAVFTRNRPPARPMPVIPGSKPNRCAYGPRP
jgi:hypothetical protein